ncbi:MAG: hypothetical protein QGG39_17440, partial [Candidatus Poribacteria bacterium]|nr:hypothetical protein [Candidatus Poribacteria bacterium]
NTRGIVMKIGDLVRFRLRPSWLGIIVDETPGTMKLKTVEWVHLSGWAIGSVSRGAYKEKDLELINENR